MTRDHLGSALTFFLVHPLVGLRNGLCQARLMPPNGRSNAGYGYSDDAYSHLTFQVIGSRIKPGYAEKGIVSSAVELINESSRAAPPVP